MPEEYSPKVIITGITKVKPRLDLAKEIGIDITVDSLVEDLREVILTAKHKEERS